jgi:hypothetical protein
VIPLGRSRTNVLCRLSIFGNCLSKFGSTIDPPIMLVEVDKDPSEPESIPIAVTTSVISTPPIDPNHWNIVWVLLSTFFVCVASISQRL